MSGKKIKNNRRGFLSNIGIAIAGAAATAVVVPQIAKATTQSNTTEPNVNTVNGNPTFEDCYQKVLRQDPLTELEGMIYSSEMNRLAWASDIAVVRNLRATCTNEKEFNEKFDAHKSSRNSLFFYWSALHYPNPTLDDNLNRNIINVHKYVCVTILTLCHDYFNFATGKYA